MFHEIQDTPRRTRQFPGGNTMSYEEYDAIDAMRQSTIKHILVSPKRFKRLLGVEQKETQALRFGRAADVAAFEPHRFALQFAVEEEGEADRTLNRSTLEGKAREKEWLAAVPGRTKIKDAEEWKRTLWQEAHPGRTQLSRDEHDRAWKCGEIIRRHPLTAPYFRDGGLVQVALEWTDPATEIRCKARIDLLSQHGPTIIDMKTCRTADRRLFGAQVNQLGYHFQGAWYRDGWKACFGEYLPFKLAVIESDGDHDVGLFGLEGDALQQGNDLVRKALDTYARCRDSGQWPGRYSEEEPIQLPAYAMAMEDGGEFSVTESEVP